MNQNYAGQQMIPQQQQQQPGLCLCSSMAQQQNIFQNQQQNIFQNLQQNMFQNQQQNMFQNQQQNMFQYQQHNMFQNQQQNMFQYQQPNMFQNQQQMGAQRSQEMQPNPGRPPNMTTYICNNCENVCNYDEILTHDCCNGYDGARIDFTPRFYPIMKPQQQQQMSGQIVNMSLEQQKVQPDSAKPPYIQQAPNVTINTKGPIDGGVQNQKAPPYRETDDTPDPVNVGSIGEANVDLQPKPHLQYVTLLFIFCLYFFLSILK